MKVNNYNSWHFFKDYKLDPVHLYAYVDQVFTKHECEEIINIGKNFTSEGSVRGGLNDLYRNSQISWIYPDEKHDWIFNRMTEVILNLNERFFKFDIYGLLEGIQFTKYESPGGRYGKHIDSQVGGEVRKLSFTLQLSDSNDYEGGDLCLYTDDFPMVMSREQGHVSLFPSYVVHEVTPVTKGTRYSLVSWITGKPFK